jgi:hypothetical protein
MEATIRSVKLFYHRSVEHGFMVEARAADGLAVAALGLQEMSAWLARHGFSWAPGTNGVWVR